MELWSNGHNGGKNKTNIEFFILYLRLTVT